jgi:hypothetical protein
VRDVTLAELLYKQTQKELYERALLHSCPACGAKPGKRCGWYQEPVNNRGYPQVRRWHTTPTLLHNDRIPLCAWLVDASDGWQKCDQLAPYVSKLDNPPLPMCEKHADGVHQYGLKS